MSERGLLAAGAALLLGVAALNMGAVLGPGRSGSAPPSPTSPAPSPPPSATPSPAAQPELETPHPVFALAAGFRLRLPSEEVRLVAFHEASLAGALRMHPIGRCAPCRHPGFVPKHGQRVGLRYAVMDPRGRPWAPTTAVDLMVDADRVLRAPVSGRVRVSRAYRLYGRYRDHRLVIVPDGAVGVEVVMLHLRGGTLSPGDRVVASETPIGRARRLPFSSQVDRYGTGGHPHVHLEVVDAEARREAKNRRRDRPR